MGKDMAGLGLSVSREQKNRGGEHWVSTEVFVHHGWSLGALERWCFRHVLVPGDLDLTQGTARTGFVISPEGINSGASSGPLI